MAAAHRFEWRSSGSAGKRPGGCGWYTMTWLPLHIVTSSDRTVAKTIFMTGSCKVTGRDSNHLSKKEQAKKRVWKAVPTDLPEMASVAPGVATGLSGRG